MSDRQRDELDELVLTCLDRIESEGLSAIDELCREHPRQAAALRARLEGLLDAGLLAEPDAPPERLGDFRLGARLGGGGMGVVYAAVQESLGREVALKIVRSDQLYFPGARERFRREVQLVARLAHAGIVPVFTVGEEGGVPYFAMERLQGATLAEALALLDQPPRRGADLAAAVAGVVERQVNGRKEPTPDVSGELYEGSGVQTCLRIAQRMAEALAHAHERGVLHRDLKPSNVMLTTDGRALLFDFGLASSRDSASLTRSGSRVGSLAYMAPEQVRGEEAEERTDVYGLGALLFEALTLRPPHVGAPEGVAAAILRGEPVAVRRRRGDLSRDVATVVETALAPDPTRRYPSASAMARDLGHVLAGEPVEARRVGRVGRATRWTRRHPARAGLLAALVLVPVLFGIQQYGARQRIAEQSERAEANLDRTLAALDVFVWNLATGPLEHVPDLDAGRLEMFEAALASVDELAQQRPDDAHLRCRAVRLNSSFGSVLLDMGQLAEAERRFRDALVRGEQDIHPEEVVPALNGLGNLLDKRGQLQDALELFEEAARRSPTVSSKDLAMLSAIQRNVARMHRRQGHKAANIEAAEASIASAEQALVRAITDEDRFEARRALADALNARAIPWRAPRRQLIVDARGREAFSRALPLALELAEESPRRTDVALSAATVSVNAAHYLPLREAEQAMREGLALVEGLSRDFPDRAEYLRIHVALLGNLGLSLVDQGRVADAREPFERATRIGGSRLEQGDEDLNLLLVAGRADVNLATNLVHLELRAEGCDAAARGAARLKRARARLPGDPYIANDLAWARIQEGYGRLALGDAERTRELADAIPVVDLNDAMITVGVGELVAGCADLETDPERAEQLREEALDLLEAGLELGFDRYEYLRIASEWASLRKMDRFEALLRGATE